MAYEQILYSVEDRILTLTLNRVERLNAFTGVMCRELIDAFDRADADDSVRAVIVTGAGKAFCAGADLGGGSKTFDASARGARDSIEEHRDGGGLLTLRIYDGKKPVIAAINGAAVGIGITMTLPMDVRIASTGARMGFVFARRGIVPEACSSFFLPRVVGIAQALRWCYSGRVFPAVEALAGGLVSEVLPAGDLLASAQAIAREIAGNTAPVSIALIRQMMWRGLGARHPMDMHRVDSRGILSRGRSADVAEGVTAFLDKRQPVFPDTVSADLPDYFPWWDEPHYG